MIKNTGDEMNLNIEEREVFLFVDNDGEIYRGMIRPLINNYARRLVKGDLDAVKAVKGFVHPVEAGMKKYAREFGPAHWYDLLTVEERKRVATALLASYSDEITDRANEIARK